MRLRGRLHRFECRPTLKNILPKISSTLSAATPSSAAVIFGRRRRPKLCPLPPTNGRRRAPASGPKSVESRCGAVALGRTYLLPPLSFGGASMVPPWLRFHIPLIEPDRQISRIRLSDKTSRFRVQRHLQLLNIYRS